MTPETTEATEAGGKGGDVNLIVGAGYNAPSGTFRWQIPNEDGSVKEVLRIEPDGRFYVYGHETTTDMLVYQAFRSWLASAHAELAAGSGGLGASATTGNGLKIVAVPEEAVSQQFVCSSCEQPFRTGVAIVIPDGHGRNRHIVGSSECQRKL